MTQDDDQETPFEADRNRIERTGAWGPAWGPFHRHSGSDEIHRDGGPECDQAGSPRRVYVFDPDSLGEHEAIVARWAAGRAAVSYEGWVHDDGCAVCPRCNAFIPCEDGIGSILAAIPGHDCYASPGTGHYLRPPEVPAEGRYWAEPDGTYRGISDDPPRLPVPLRRVLPAGRKVSPGLPWLPRGIRESHAVLLPVRWMPEGPGDREAAGHV